MKNLGKKEQRLQLLEYKTKALTEKGYIKETYSDLLIFTNEPELTLKIFRGTATNLVLFIRLVIFIIWDKPLELQQDILTHIQERL